MVICLEQGADLHTARMMPLPLTVSCFSKIQIGFTFLVLAHLGSPGKGPLIGVCVCVHPMYWPRRPKLTPVYLMEVAIVTTLQRVKHRWPCIW